MQSKKAGWLEINNTVETKPLEKLDWGVYLTWVEHCLGARLHWDKLHRLIFMDCIVYIPEQCVFQYTYNTSVHTNTTMLCKECFISCYCLLLYRLLFHKKWDHDIVTLLLCLGLDQPSGWWSCLVERGRFHWRPTSWHYPSPSWWVCSSVIGWSMEAWLNVNSIKSMMENVYVRADDLHTFSM